MDDKDEELAMDVVDEPKISDPAPEETQPRDEHGKFKSDETGVKEETPQDEPGPPPEQSEHVPMAALKDERRKRQELEQQIAAFQQQQQKPPEPPPEFWDNPDEAIDRRVSAAVGSALEQWQQRQEIERVNQSEAVAKSKYEDYGEAFSAFQEATRSNPRLVEQMMQSGDPGEYAYKTGKRSLELDRVGSIDELLKAERAKWESEVRATAPSFPQSTIADGSAAPRAGPGWSGPVADKDILPMG